MNISHIRQCFPIFGKKDIVYLDTAASAQKPQSVIDAISHFYAHDYANVHRGSHFLSDRATEKYENTRNLMASFINATSPREIVFGKNATEMINLVAHSLESQNFFKEGDTILLSRMEHHANLIPWIMLAKRRNLKIDFLELNENFELLLNKEQFNGVKLVACSHVSNVLGTRNDIDTICQFAREAGAYSLVDGCQAVPHFSTDVQKIGCDFFVFSGHKMYGPSGVGVLYGKMELLKNMPPFLGGGDMIRSVSFYDFVAHEIPYRFEAGTPPIEAVVGCGAAVEFLTEIGMNSIAQHDEKISSLAQKKLSEIPEIKIVSHERANGLITFSAKKKQNYDLSDFLSDHGICVRVGHHCAEPLHALLGEKTTVRASFGVYTTEEEIDILAKRIQEFFSSD